MDKDEFIAAAQKLYGKFGWQAQLADDLHKSRATIWRYAHGKQPVPRGVELAMKGLEAERDRG